jgi:hypothetical protein
MAPAVTQTIPPPQPDRPRWRFAGTLPGFEPPIRENVNVYGRLAGPD